jgi:hypothetical protein
MTSEQYAELKRQLDQSEAMHHKIMAKMADPKFDLLGAWEQKERLDVEIGRFIRASMRTTQ